MIDALAASPRLVVRAALKPVAGSSFQPTGFPDLGAATFRRPVTSPDGGHDWQSALLVESVQSMANRFEERAWDDAARKPVAAIDTLPYVEVVDGEGGFLTSSRLEPHRLAAAYIRDGKIDGTGGKEWIGEQLGLVPGRPLDWRSIYRSVLELDPLCLVHGVFFSDKAWHGNPKIRRVLSAVIEAHGAEEVVSGGLKRDDVAFKAGGRGSGQSAEEGYGFIPFPRTEYVAQEIELTAVVDLEQIRGYGLDEQPTRLLTLLALWEFQEVLTRPLRLRTACDLELIAAPVIDRPDGFELPSAGELAAELRRLDVTFEHPGARQAVWAGSAKRVQKRSPEGVEAGA